MLRTDCLPTETGRLLALLEGDPAIGRFTLVGGSGLALSFGHRLSEDLDFAVPAFDLPRGECAAVLRRIEEAGWQIDDISDPMTRLYQENEGADLADSQQDWLCRRPGAESGVKLTFFAEYLPAKHPAYDRPRLNLGQVAVMPPDGIFLLKAQLLLRRQTMRDLFDIWAFLERGYSVEELLRFAQMEDRHCSYEKLRARLVRPHIRASDPGLASLVASGPAGIVEIVAALEHHLDRYESRVAAAMLIENSGQPGDLTP